MSRTVTALRLIGSWITYAPSSMKIPALSHIAYIDAHAREHRCSQGATDSERGGNGSACDASCFFRAFPAFPSPAPGSANDGDAESAAQGWRAASAAMQQAAGDFEAEVEPGDTDRIDVSCPEGGTVAIDGSASDERFDLTVSFDGCRTQDVQTRRRALLRRRGQHRSRQRIRLEPPRVPIRR